MENINTWIMKDLEMEFSEEDEWNCPGILEVIKELITILLSAMSAG